MTQTEKKEKAGRLAEALEKLYPAAECALHYEGEGWKLLVMGILSAQCTDKRVNEVCLSLFARFPSCEALARGDQEEICTLVRPCGCYRVKGAHLKACCTILSEQYGGRVPEDMDVLLTFPGVGRKIANLLRGDLYHLPAIVADTHCIRLCERFGLTPEGTKDPLKTEKVMVQLIDPEKQSDFCHRLVLFGREYCAARAPRCNECPLSELCGQKKKEA